MTTTTTFSLAPEQSAAVRALVEIEGEPTALRGAVERVIEAFGGLDFDAVMDRFEAVIERQGAKATVDSLTEELTTELLEVCDD